MVWASSGIDGVGSAVGEEAGRFVGQEGVPVGCVVDAAGGVGICASRGPGEERPDPVLVQAAQTEGAARA